MKALFDDSELMIFTCKDIFLVNIPRSFDSNDVPYTALEEIKDGQAIDAKYDSKVISLHTPNVLAIFSNNLPKRLKVSTDRWEIYVIDKVTDDLVYRRANKAVIC